MYELIIATALAVMTAVFIFIHRRSKPVMADDVLSNDIKAADESTGMIDQDQLRDILHRILHNVEGHRSYYAGGTLCVDGIIPGDVLMVNLDGKYNSFMGGETREMGDANWSLAFSVYLKYRGDTDYYKEMMAKRQ